ncbi:hypothetical protein Bca4012_014142 [Brassica carinata]
MLTKVLADKKTLKCLAEKMVLQESNGKDNRGRACLIKTLDDKEWKRIGIASAVSYENESVYILYDAIFFQLSNGEIETSEDGFIDALKNILRKFEELLKSTQLVHSATNLQSWPFL